MRPVALVLGFWLALGGAANAETVVIEADIIHPVSAPAIANGRIVVVDGRIRSVGPARGAPPDGARVLRGSVATPGLVDAHTSCARWTPSTPTSRCCAICWSTASWWCRPRRVPPTR